jgi:hypothetical protein
MFLFTGWFQLTSLQTLLLGMMVMMSIVSLVHYLTFRISSSGLRLLFNLTVIHNILALGLFQAGQFGAQHYYLITNGLTLGSFLLYARLMHHGLDLHFYERRISKVSWQLLRILSWLGLLAFLIDLTLNTYLMSMMIIAMCVAMLYVILRIRILNKSLPAYIHIFLWGAGILLVSALFTFGSKFAAKTFHIDTQMVVHYLLLPALSIEFMAFTSGDILRLRHAVIVRDKLLDEVKMARGEQREQESLSLAFKLNTHTLANILNRIQHSLVKHDATVAMELVHEYSAYLRSILQLDESGSHSLKEEIELLKRYLELNKLQFGPKFAYSIQLKANLDLQVPCMICLPGVENAIIHGFSDGLTLSPHIDIQFKEEDGLLVVNICDNGKGLPEIFSDKSSFGLRNTRKRMALLSEKTGTKSTFQIINRSEDDPQAKGVCLILGIPTLQPQTPNLNKRKTT